MESHFELLYTFHLYNITVITASEKNSIHTCIEFLGSVRLGASFRRSQKQQTYTWPLRTSTSKTETERDFQNKGILRKDFWEIFLLHSFFLKT